MITRRIAGIAPPSAVHLTRVINAEVADEITIDFTLVDMNGNVQVESEIGWWVTLYDFGDLSVTAPSTSFKSQETGDGSTMMAPNNPYFFATSLTVGVKGTAQLTITDVIGASGATLLVTLMPVSFTTPVTALTFDPTGNLHASIGHFFGITFD